MIKRYEASVSPCNTPEYGDNFLYSIFFFRYDEAIFDTFRISVFFVKVGWLGFMAYQPLLVILRQIHFYVNNQFYLKQFRLA